MMKSPELNFDDSEYLSKEGFEHLQKEKGDRIIRREEIAGRLEYAKSLGDISENTEYQSAKDEQWRNESRIAKLEDILSRAKLILKEKSPRIQLGSLVSIKKEQSEEIENYSIVGHEEADPLSGKISHESPIGGALLGKKSGEIIEVITPGGKISYNIIDVR